VAAGVGIGASVVAYRRFLGTTLDVVQGIGGGRSWVVCALERVPASERAASGGSGRSSPSPR